MARSVAVCMSAGALAAIFVPEALAVKVHVRVEGKTRTIFGPTAPLIDVTSPRANPLPETPLDALATASVLGEFYYHVANGPFRVDQIGRYAAVGQTGWLFRVNGVSPAVGANQYRLKKGDTVLWYWAQFGIVPGGPKTLVLTRLGKSNCYRVQAQDDDGVLTAADGAVLHVGKRTVKTQGATQFALGCVGPHRGRLVRATLGGAVRSNALP
ncbi:MAG TPA: DUF4430 domain-containing protein [Gaiellaceae bacterium]|nr:DUF4430 domain-containing protein [Gaiellaceae bacterium]